MAIRFDAKTNNEISRVVRNFNNKISRLEKTERELYLPEKVSIRDLKSNVTNRNELKRELNKLRSFSERGAEETVKGLDISLYELRNIEKETRRIKASLTRQIKRISNIKPTIFGIEQSASYSQMGSQQLANLKARRQHLNVGSIKSLSKQGLKDYIGLLESNIRREKYKTEIFMNNYIDKILFNLGYFINYDKDKLNTLREKLTGLEEKDFLKLFDTEQSIQAIKDYYPEVHRNNMDKIQDDVSNLYDELFNNIDKILEDYKH